MASTVEVNGKNVSSKYEFVILSKLDKEGNLTLLHSKPLTLELFNQIPDSVISFTEGIFKKALINSNKIVSLNQVNLFF